MAAVDATYLINMRDARARMRRAAAHLRDAGLRFTRVEGVDGRTSAASRTSDIHPSCALACSPGALGCALSHLDVWRTCCAEGHAAALVLEDDVQLVPEFVTALGHAMRRVPEDYDIVLLGYEGAAAVRPTFSVMPTHREARRVSEGITAPEAFYGTHAYVISAKGARALRDMRVTFQVDIQLSLMSALKIYAVTPQLATQVSQESFVSPHAFPVALNSVVRTMEVPGLNLFGRSVPPSAMWFVGVCIMGYLRVKPMWVAAALGVEAVVGGVDGWWAASTVAWLIFSFVRT